MVELLVERIGRCWEMDEMIKQKDVTLLILARLTLYSAVHTGRSLPSYSAVTGHARTSIIYK